MQPVMCPRLDYVKGTAAPSISILEPVKMPPEPCDAASDRTDQKRKNPRTGRS